jgi:hypothetical protein
MHGRGTTTTIGAVTVAAVGLVLLVVESIQAIRGQVLSSVDTTLLFVGLGLVVVAMATLAVSISTEPVTAEPVTDPSPAAPEAPVTPAEPVESPEPPPAPVLDDTEADAAASWTLVHRVECAARLEAGDLQASVRRGATLAVYNEGVFLAVGTLHQHRSWPNVRTITAGLAGAQATIDVGFTIGSDDAVARFTGKNRDLAPLTTALVSAAPAALVAVTYS